MPFGEPVVITKALINNKIVAYDSCSESCSDRHPYPGFKYIGNGTIYSTGGSLWKDNKIFSFFVKSNIKGK